MPYDFDKPIDRQNSSSVKWNLREKMFGSQQILPLWVADMDFPTAPPIIHALQERIQHGVFGYDHFPVSFYEAIIHWSFKRYKWAIQQDWIVHAVGVVPAIGMIIRRFTAPGDKIIIQQPVYHLFEKMIRDNNRIVVNNALRLDTQKYVIDFDRLESCLAKGAKLFILCSPHNPVGRVWTREELLRIGELCVKYNTLLVSDEIHADLTYPGYQHVPISSLSEAICQNTITCMAPSKAFNLAGLQIAYLIIPNERLREQYKIEQNTLDLSLPNNFGMVALEAAYTQCDNWLNELMAYLKNNLDYLTKLFAEKMPQIKIIQPEATYLLWLDCRELQLDDAALRDLFYKKMRWGLDSGTKFGLGGEGFMRLNFACSRQLFTEAKACYIA